ncbi:hypothetical protein M406DRAFT_281903 [Cryphonectria parasitica EP155]|uniref:DUF2461 domain-containing protein n=1 Tax=Cryphonectria parasitica (strain ATCC 38755 / EP155) TaxID=660469 RepID=A0A9P4XVR7_CRYP1|nr:uncharacterized protein M406DRAFT_281903 [Cryphonectria parasitica EP155]KAF3761806.1 hypothetical protein M406DRAFT_281903 [Cryphonectria parasitica EP155]
MPAAKRKAPDTPLSEPSGRRRSGRISSSGKKSQYFEGDSQEDEDSDDAFEVEEHSTITSNKSQKRKRGRPSKKQSPAAQRAGRKRARDESEEEEDGDEYAEEGLENEDEDEDELDEDAEPRVTIIPYKKMRDTGGVPYEDDRLHKNTMLFLKDLKANNKRSWLKSTDDEYRRSLKDWNTFVETLTQRIITADPTIPELPIKDVVFRIYRDIRFSKDPTPYKPHYSAAFSRTGRKGPYACYYVHCEPGACFVGGGTWMPDAGRLARLRASVDEHPRRWRRVLGEEGFRRTFLPGTRQGDVEGCVKAFAKYNKSNALKTKPKGFDAGHRDIELLKLRNFTIGKKVPDSIFTAPDAQDQITAIVQAMVGYITFLNDIVMPDPNVDSDSSSDEEDEEGEE